MANFATCEKCNMEIRLARAHFGKRISCPKCKHQFIAPTPDNIAPAQLQPPVRAKVVVSSSIQKPPYSQKEMLFVLPIIAGGIGMLFGGIVGFFSAHHFALWGGFMLMGEPYSQARYSLVPGHVLFFGVLFGCVGIAAGVFIQKAFRR